MGAQVLDLAAALDAAPQLPARAPDVVFFDLFGLTTVHYPAWLGWLMLGGAALGLGMAARGEQGVGRGALRMLGLIGAGDDLAAALSAKAAGLEASPAGSLIAACDLLEEVIEWLAAGELRGAAAPAAIDRLRVAQVLLREHQFDSSDLDDLEPPSHHELVLDEPSSSSTPTAWVDED